MFIRPLIIALIICVAALPQNVCSQIQIQSAEDLLLLTQYPAGEFTVENDINASELEWISGPVTFSGRINGNGHNISNLTIIATAEHCGMFARLTKANISNLNFIDPAVELTAYEGQSAGFLADEVNSSVMSCIGLYYLSCSGDYSGAFGGLGVSGNTAYIDRCSVYEADINLPRAAVCGAIIAQVWNQSTISACSSSGTLRADHTIGGIVGHIESSDVVVRNCHGGMNIFGNHTIGGIAGINNRSVIRNSLVTGNIICQGEGENGVATGGIAGILCKLDDTNEDNSRCIYNSLVMINTLRSETDDTKKTFHRVVGSVANGESGLWNNYCHSYLQPIGTTNATHSNAEGSSRDYFEITAAFMSQLSFSFGTAELSPWIRPEVASDLMLYYEELPVKLEVTEVPAALDAGEEASVTFKVSGSRADLLDIAFEHPYAFDICQTDFDSRTVTVRFKVRIGCISSVTARCGELSVTCPINAMAAAVGNILPEGEAPVEYFDLQGIRVSEPVKGRLYIERRGGATRVVSF